MISSLSFEWGMTTLSCRAREALRRRVSMSPTGSLTGMGYLPRQGPFPGTPRSQPPRLPGPSRGFEATATSVQQNFQGVLLAEHVQGAHQALMGSPGALPFRLPGRLGDAGDFTAQRA